MSREGHDGFERHHGLDNSDGKPQRHGVTMPVRGLSRRWSDGGERSRTGIRMVAERMWVLHFQRPKRVTQSGGHYGLRLR